MKSKKSLLLGLSLFATVGFCDLAASAGVGTMAAADEMEWKEVAPGSPLMIAVVWGGSE